MAFKKGIPGLLLAVGFLAVAAAAEPPPGLLLRFEGNAAYSGEELAKLIPMDEATVPDEGWVEAVRRAVLGQYETYGYLLARVTAAARPTADGTDVVVSIVEGPRFQFGPTKVQGLGVRARVVLRELTYKEGDFFNSRELLRTRRRLHKLSLFDDLRIVTSTGPANKVWVLVQGKPATTQKLRGGVGYGSEERQRLSLGYSNTNFLRRGYRMDLSAVHTAISVETKAELIDRYLFGTETEGRAEAGWRRESQDGYRFERTRTRFALGRDLKWNLTGSAAYRLERTVTFDVTRGLSILNLAPNGVTSAVETGLVHDTTRDPFFPTNGGRTHLSFDRAGGFLGGDVHFTKWLLRASRYWAPWGPRLVGAVQLRAGTAWPYGDSAEVPIYDRFFTGGANSVRGYRERGVGPQVDGAPLGGTKVSGGSAEARFPLWGKFNGAVFIDGGQVGQEYSDVDPIKWKLAAGTGVRFNTPVGPVRLDFGYKLNRDAGDDDLWRLHLSLGEAF